MEWVSFSCRLAIAAVFVTSGVAKLLDPGGTREAVGRFGVPRRLRAGAAVVLPVSELALALALLPAGSAVWALFGATALLALFTAAIAVNVLRGRRFDCHCFGAALGSLGGGSIGPATLARNGAFLAVALGGLALDRSAGRTPSAVAWLAGLSGAELAALAVAVVILAAAALEGWAILQLIAQNGRLLTRLVALEERGGGNGASGPETGLPVGAPAPAFALPGIHGESTTLDSLRAAGSPVLLAFTDPGCGPCSELLPDFARWQREAAAAVTIALISRRSADENRQKVGAYALAHILLQQDREVMQAYRAEATPSMVAVNPDGTIASTLAVGAEQVRALVARFAGPGQARVAPGPIQSGAIQPASGGSTPCPSCGQVHAPAAQATGPVVGSPAPGLRLPDLDGRETDLADYRGRDTLVLFWDPACGFCQQMLADLKAAESARPPHAPALLVVSTGTRGANAGQGLASPVLLDQGFAAGRAFGVQGTPSAVLIGADGSVAAPAAVGAPGVLALVRGGP